MVAPAVQAMLDGVGDAAAAAVTFLVAVDGRLAYRDGRRDDARRLLTRAAELARIAGHPSQRVYVLTALAGADLAAGDRAAAKVRSRRSQGDGRQRDSSPCNGGTAGGD